MKKILQIVNDRPIPVKLGVMLLVPLLLLGYMAAQYLPYEAKRLTQAEEDIEAIRLAQQLDQMAHHLAIERGLSAGYIGQSGAADHSALQQQRKVVDRHLQQFIKTLTALEFDALSQRLDQGDLNMFRQESGRVALIRARVDRHEEGSMNYSFDYYSNLNMTLLFLIQNLVDSMERLEIMRQFDLVNNLLWIKERAGQERGRLNHFFSKGEMSIEPANKISHAIEDQRLKVQEFMRHASSEQKRRYRQEVGVMESDQIAPYRTIFLSRLKKQELIEELRGLLGFGGMIHIFKNYVIRGDERLWQQFEQKHRKIIENLNRYRMLEGVTSEELEYLQEVEQNVNQYRQNLEIVASYGERMGLIGQIDRRVKVDDAPALAALDRLSTYVGGDASHWFSVATSRIERIGAIADWMGAELLQSALQEAAEIEREYLNYRNALLAMLLVVAVMAWYLWRQLSCGVQDVLSTIRQVEESGDLRSRIAVHGGDEIGQISQALNTLFATYHQAIEEAVDVSTAVAEGRFDQRMEQRYRGDLYALQEGINGSAERVAQYTQAKDEFMASMSHELRTPLTAIIGNSELLIDLEEDQEKQVLIRSIEMAGRGQLALVNDILDMSKIESGKFLIDDAPYDLEVMLSQVEQIFSVRAQDAGLRFEMELKEVLRYQLLGDAQRINQILLNLISNAIKFTVEGFVRLIVWNSAGQLHFRVEDSGIGISDELQERLFQRFEQADGSISRRFGGSGLGLYISDSLAELMGGSIEVSSREQEGSIFQLNLPYRESDYPVQMRTIESAAGGGESERLEGRVLIAEDTPELQLLTQRIVQSMGVSAEVVDNGRAAVEKVRDEDFDLVLMDMQMPEMDGIEATRSLRQQGDKTPIIALTANVMQKHRDSFSAAGGDGFLAKPIDRQLLHKELVRFLAVQEELATTEEAAVSSASMAMSPEIPEQADTLVDDELMQLFVERITEHRAELVESMSTQDWERARFAAHTVKGSGASFGYPELTQCGKMVCDAVDQGSMDELPRLTMQLVTEIDNTLNH